MKRRITIIMVFILLGAIANVAVAWEYVLRRRANVERFVTMQREVLNLMEHVLMYNAETGRTYGRWREYIPDSEVVERRSRAFQTEYVHRTIPDASHARAERIDALVTGWPVQSFRTPWQSANPAVLPTTVPCIPVLPGFIINTLGYAAVLWLLFVVPFTARRMIRRKRGQCQQCGSPSGTSAVCTECGAAVARECEPANARKVREMRI